MTRIVSQTQPDDAEDARSAPLGKSAGRGAVFVMLSSLFLRIFSFLGQIVLGTLLFDADFGLFAIATSCAAFVQFMCDGGMRTLVVQRGEQAYDDLEGPAFWISVLFSCTLGALLAGMAPIVGRIYGEPELTRMLWLIAVAMPLSSAGAMSIAVLHMRMRFGAIAAIQVGSGAIRYGGMVAGALMGFGAIAFVAPLPVIAIFEAAAAYAATRRTPWRRSPRFERWPSLLKDAIWLILATLAGASLYTGSHMVLGLTATTALVGLYYFGYSVIQQSAYLIVWSIERVLFPVVSRLRNEPERQRSVIIRTLQATTVLGGAAGAGLGASFGPLENLVWQGKWAGSIGVARIIAISYTLFGLLAIARTVILGEGRFKAYALSLFAAGAVLMGFAALAGALADTAQGVAWITGAAMGAISIAYIRWAVSRHAIGMTQILQAIGPTWLCCIAAMLLGIFVDDTICRQLIAASRDPLADQVATRVWINGLRIAAAGTTTALSLAVLLRAVVPAALRECLVVVPDRLGRLGAAVLRLDR